MFSIGYEAALKKLKFGKASATDSHNWPLSIRNDIEQNFATEYDKMVRAGTAPKLRRKYRKR